MFKSLLAFFVHVSEISSTCLGFLRRTKWDYRNLRSIIPEAMLVNFHQWQLLKGLTTTLVEK